MPNRPLLEAEIKLLFALLDAADEAGAVQGPNQIVWADAKRRFKAWSPAEVAPSLFQLLDELHASGAIQKSWVQSRWLAIRAQLESHGHPPHHRV